MCHVVVRCKNNNKEEKEIILDEKDKVKLFDQDPNPNYEYICGQSPWLLQPNGNVFEDIAFHLEKFDLLMLDDDLDRYWIIEEIMVE